MAITARTLMKLSRLLPVSVAIGLGFSGLAFAAPADLLANFPFTDGDDYAFNQVDWWTWPVANSNPDLSSVNLGSGQFQVDATGVGSSSDMPELEDPGSPGSGGTGGGGGAAGSAGTSSGTGDTGSSAGGTGSVPANSQPGPAALLLGLAAAIGTARRRRHAAPTQIDSRPTAPSEGMNLSGNRGDRSCQPRHGARALRCSPNASRATLKEAPKLTADPVGRPSCPEIIYNRALVERCAKTIASEPSKSPARMEDTGRTRSGIISPCA